MIRLTILVPKRENFEPERFEEITEEDCHPVMEELENRYIVANQPKDNFRCGDVILLESEYHQFKRYYFIARNGFEIVDKFDILSDLKL